MTEPWRPPERAGADSELGLTTTEVARQLGVDVSTVRRWIDTGYLESFRTPGRHRRVSKDALQRFIDRHTRGPRIDA